LEYILEIFVLIVIVQQLIFWQVYLSKREDKWLGVILPAMCFISSLFITMNSVVYGNYSMTESYIYSGSNGEIIKDLAMTHAKTTPIYTIIYDFFRVNALTVILLIIYFACRESIKKNRELYKMNILDL
jgi:hypothetical protein